MDWKVATKGLKREIESGNVTLHQVLAELEPTLPQRLALLEQTKEAFGIAQDELLLGIIKQARTHMLMSQFFGSMFSFPQATQQHKQH
ncbi:hypothetical protein [Paenibacillus sp. PDC88]|uniref:hypothetical protein n=1 Tax=Paenibacillus TaxID=44249 RepID=UPI0008955EE9|nr:hypothetical protein [Paenibacillus sp. PDC88]SDX82539.1 hypothetical protein SAMN05518848_11812 [Paenibacillus sp. PDC88]